MNQDEQAIQFIETNYLAAFKQLAENEKIKKQIEADEKAIKADLKKVMEEYGVKSLKNDFITMTLVDGSTSTSIDLKAIEKAEPELYEDLLADYPKVTTKKPYITFRVK